MQKIYFILNLVAGKAVIAKKLGGIIDEFVKADFEITVHTTQSGEDAMNAAKYACSSGFDMLVCAGGDGTLSQCLQGIMRSEKRIPIGYIPAGSTNDFAKSLGIPKDTMAAVRNIISGHPASFDVGGLNDDYFTYIAAFGAFTNITYETSQQVKNIFGHAAYILNGLTQLTSIRSSRMRIEFDETVLEDDFLFGMVTNTSSVAGLLSINDFRLDDGVFEVVLIKKPSNIIQLQQIIHSLLNINEEINKEYIKFFRTNKITFTSLGEEPVTWTRDGEYGGNSPTTSIFNYNQAASFIVGDNTLQNNESSTEAEEYDYEIYDSDEMDDDFNSE
jgi:lipid kinase, YegS/Rv2252/BmrU family